MEGDRERLCPQCGLELPPAGPCPHCLLRLALGDEAEAEALPAATRRGPKPPTGLQSRFFGDFEILDEIARGGMGVVYRARQLSLKRVVALKMIHASHLMSPEARLRFAMEVSTAAQLNHPHIISLYESGEFKGTHFFTMRLVEGGDLAQHIKAGAGGLAPLCAAPPLRSEDAIATLVIKSARALHYAHQRGILHRDLKPSNVLIDLQGEPHLADFGLAKMLARESATTFADSVLGSPNYMAPEQAAGLNAELTTATDVYGLGAVLYEALTGIPPYRASTPVETIRKVLDEDPVAPRKLKPGIDPDLETICLKCLQKKPSDRYGTAEQLAEDLERWQKGLPIVARPVGSLGLAWRWVRRHPAIVSLAVALILALVAGALGVGLALLRVRDAERRAVGNLRESLLGEARALCLSGQTGMRNESIRLISQASALGGPPDFRRRARDQMLAALALPDMAFSPQLADVAEINLCLLDPTMERWASIQQRTNLVIQRVSDRVILLNRPVSSQPVVRLEAFSSDGRLVALRLRDGLSWWDVEAGREVFATNGARRLFSFASQAARVALEESDGSVTIRELPTFGVVHRVGGRENAPGRRTGWDIFSLSPDASQLAGARSRGALELLEVESGRRRWQATNLAEVTAVAWSPARRRLAVAMVAGSDCAIRLFRWTDGASSVLYRAAAAVRALSFDANSTMLAIASDDGLARVVDLDARRRLFYLKAEGRNLVFDPEGVRVGPLRRGTEVGWLDLSRSAEFREYMISGFGVDVDRCAISPDGRMMIGGYSATLDFHRISDGVELIKVPVEQLPIFAFDPHDGALLTSDSRGVRRWAMTALDPGRVELGAPEMILSGRGWRSLAFNADGSRFAAANLGSGAAYVFDRSLTNELALFGPHAGVNAVAVSPDGRWLATASQRGRDLRVWNVETRAQVFQSAAGAQTRLEFSQDGRWLLMHGDILSLRATGTWQLSPPLPFAPEQLNQGPATFSPDGRVLAVVVEDFDVQLFDLAMWQPIGLLHPTGPMRLCSLAFSADGTRLVAGSTRGRLHLWSLVEIRERLREANLDWDLPRLPNRKVGAPLQEVRRARGPNAGP